MNLLDLILAVIIGASVISGFISGFAKAGIGFLAAIGGILAGFWFYDIPAHWFSAITSSKPTANLLGFFLIFFAAIMAGILVGRLVSTAFKWTGLGIVDRAMGAAFGFIRGSFAVVALVAMLVAFMPRPVPNWATGSVVLPYALGASDVASSLAPKALKNAFSQSMGEIKNAWTAELNKARNRAVESIPGMKSSAPEPKPEIVVPAEQPKKAAKAKAGKAKVVRAPKSAPPAATNQ